MNYDEAQESWGFALLLASSPALRLAHFANQAWQEECAVLERQEESLQSWLESKAQKWAAAFQEARKERESARRFEAYCLANRQAMADKAATLFATAPKGDKGNRPYSLPRGVMLWFLGGEGQAQRFLTLTQDGTISYFESKRDGSVRYEEPILTLALSCQNYLVSDRARKYFSEALSLLSPLR